MCEVCLPHTNAAKPTGQIPKSPDVVVIDVVTQGSTLKAPLWNPPAVSYPAAPSLPPETRLTLYSTVLHNKNKNKHKHELDLFIIVQLFILGAHQTNRERYIFLTFFETGPRVVRGFLRGDPKLSASGDCGDRDQVRRALEGERRA